MPTTAPDSPLANQTGSVSPNEAGDRQANDLPSSGSRPRFEQYRLKFTHKSLSRGSVHSSGNARSTKDRVRSAWELVWRFFQLLSPYRRQIFWILVSLTAATLIGLVPPAGTKFIIDYGLSGRSLPEPL